MIHVNVIYNANFSFYGTKLYWKKITSVLYNFFGRFLLCIIAQVSIILGYNAGSLVSQLSVFQYTVVISPSKVKTIKHLNPERWDQYSGSYLSTTESSATPLQQLQQAQELMQLINMIQKKRKNNLETTYMDWLPLPVVWHQTDVTQDPQQWKQWLGGKAHLGIHKNRTWNLRF